jgi:hypothetical protein
MEEGSKKAREKVVGLYSSYFALLNSFGYS